MLGSGGANSGSFYNLRPRSIWLGPLERGVPAIRFQGFRCVPNAGSLITGPILQRLFSTFPEGWPGSGLIFLRVVAAIPLLLPGIAGPLTASLPPLAVLQLVAAGAAGLLLVGCWTPVAGVLMAAAELYIALSHPADRGIQQASQDRYEGIHGPDRASEPSFCGCSYADHRRNRR